jgi:hypothetical protein
MSAWYVAALSLVQPRASWVLFGFEIVVLVAAVLGFRIGRGKHNDGPALGLLCVAGAIAVASAFGFLGSGRVLSLPSLGFTRDVSLKPYLFGRAAAAAILAGAAAWIVLARSRNLSGLSGNSMNAARSLLRLAIRRKI